ncbi:MAG TPA: nuclease-related domain-containing protein [Bacillota bacterium]|nr:nuclease-related domain-containing protein [Bacillota bacterium]
MAQLFPKMGEIKELKVQLTPGEYQLLYFLNDELDSSYEIYFQPFINGDHPDIVVMRKGSGIWIIEVKDWDLSAYKVVGEWLWELRNQNGKVKSPVSQALQYKNNLFSWHIEGLLEKKIEAPNSFSMIHYSVYFHCAIENEARQFVKRESRRDEGYFDIWGRDSLTKEKLQQLLTHRWLNRTSYYFTEELYHKFVRCLKPSEHVMEIGKEVSRSGQTCGKCT